MIDMTQIGLPVLQSLAAVPIAGTALGAAIGGLLSVLQVVNTGPKQSRPRSSHSAALSASLPCSQLTDCTGATGAVSKEHISQVWHSTPPFESSDEAPESSIGITEHRTRHTWLF
ncbi:hypothetical protein OG21DRAFT_1273458 [Imleria badia]|nr:hypothetical protein OG21DRAFT_1273458 [Imleria badia]